MRRLLTVMIMALVVSGVPGIARAHAEFVSSTPADGETVDVPPTEIVITFEGELQPEGSGFAVAGPGGEIGTGGVDLEVPERNVLRGPISIADAGIYTVKWTVVAADGDEQLGDFSFTVSGGGGVPETALAAPDGPMQLAATVIGAGLLIGSLALVVWRRRRA